MTSVDTFLTDHLDLWTSATVRKSPAGRGRSKKFSLYGIDKLRKLILDLAVRGKLVPQDPADEPASELLKRIDVERRGLVSDESLKRDKLLKAPDELPFPIPPTWVWSRLGCVTNYGDTEKQNPDEVEPETWVLELEDIEKGTSRLIQRVRYSERRFQSQKNKFAPGDVLYGKLRPYLDKVLIADEFGVCTTEMVPIRAYAGLRSPYLRLFLKAPYFISLASASTHGMNLPRLGTDRAREAPIAIPPLAEQHRIVTKVEELMALCDRLEARTHVAIEAHQLLVTELLATLTASGSAGELAESWARIETHFDTLFVTEDSVDQLKHAILQLAVMGSLVPQDPKDAPASELLKSIKAEKERLLLSGAGRSEKTLSPITAKEMPFELPKSWAWSRIGELALSSQYGTSRKSTVGGEGIPVLAMGNITDGKVDLCSNKKIPFESEELSELFLRDGDILYNRTNSYELVGKTGIYKGEYGRYTFASYLIRIRLDNRYVVPEYMNYVMNSKYFRLTQVVPKITKQTGQANVSGSSMRNMIVPVPPYEEQCRIVATIERLTTLCDALNVLLQSAAERQSQFADTVVVRAAG